MRFPTFGVSLSLVIWDKCSELYWPAYWGKSSTFIHVLLLWVARSFDVRTTRQGQLSACLILLSLSPVHSHPVELACKMIRVCVKGDAGPLPIDGAARRFVVTHFRFSLCWCFDNKKYLAHPVISLHGHLWKGSPQACMPGVHVGPTWNSRNKVNPRCYVITGLLNEPGLFC